MAEHEGHGDREKAPRPKKPSGGHGGSRPAGSQGGGLNGTYRLNATTVHDDAAIDELFGEAGFDWFIYTGSGAFADHLNDWQSGDAALVL